ncbi:putative amidophosphoribosyltransferase [Bradyrhizobium sp. GM22.5]
MAHLPRLALDIALPTLCVSCREPVDGEGVCAACWARLSFIERPYCPRLGIPFVYDPGPDMLSMEAIASPPAYQRARAAVRYDDVARTLGACAEIPGPHGFGARHGPLDGARGRRTARRG